MCVHLLYELVQGVETAAWSLLDVQSVELSLYLSSFVIHYSCVLL